MNKDVPQFTPPTSHFRRLNPFSPYCPAVRRICRSLRRLYPLLPVLVVCALPMAAQQRPLQTEDPTILKAGRASLEFGFDFLQDAKFPVSGLRGDQTGLGVMGLHISLAGVAEVQMDWTAHNLLSVTEATPAPVRPHLSSGGTATSDYGDLFLSTKIRMLQESDLKPSFGFFTSVQVPNASTAKGLGLNATQYRGGILVGKHFGELHVFGNLGLGILANPVLAGAQNDVMLYGLAGIYPLTSKVNLAGEVFGHRNSRHQAPLGTESLSQFRMGLQVHAGGLRWDVAAVAGLAHHSPGSGIVFGLTKQFDSFLSPKH